MFPQYGSWLPLEQVIPEQQVRRFNVLYDLVLEVALHCFQVLYWLHVCVQLLQLCLSPCDTGDCGCQAPLCMGFSRQEYWSGLLCPPPGDHFDTGIKLRLLHCRWILYHSTTWESPYRSQPYLLWEGTTQRWDTRRQRLLGTILEAGYHKCVDLFIVPYSTPVILPTTFGR